MNVLILTGLLLLTVVAGFGLLLLSQIHMKASELASQLQALSTQVTKSRNEVIKKIADLEAALADVDLPAEATTALDALKAEVQTSDDVIPDEPPAPTP